MPRLKSCSARTNGAKRLLQPRCAALLPGDRSVSGLGRTVEEFRVAHASGRRRLLRDVRPDLPPSFIRVVDAATRAVPEERPESAGALEALIERASGHVSPVAGSPGPPIADPIRNTRSRCSHSST